jgi:hypothetical protein
VNSNFVLLFFVYKAVFLLRESLNLSSCIVYLSFFRAPQRCCLCCLCILWNAMLQFYYSSCCYLQCCSVGYVHIVQQVLLLYMISDRITYSITKCTMRAKSTEEKRQRFGGLYCYHWECLKYRWSIFMNEIFKNRSINSWNFVMIEFHLLTFLIEICHDIRN